MTKRKQDVVRESPLTYDDYANLPDDGIRYELASGQLEAMTPAPHPKHQLVIQKLAYVIEESCSTDYIVFLAPVDVILSDTEVRQPDLIMLHRDRFSTLVTNRGIEGPPDLVAEVLSPFFRLNVTERISAEAMLNTGYQNTGSLI